MYWKTLIATMLEMFSNFFTRSYPNIVPELYEPECMMRRKNDSKELSYHTAGASIEMVEQKDEKGDAWMQAWEELHGEYADNVDEEVAIEDEDSELYRK